MTEAHDALATASGEPDLKELTSEYALARDSAAATQRVTLAEETRFCRWDGQSDDGLKHQINLTKGETARPWDHSADTRIPLADDVINSLTDLLVAAFWNARIKVNPVSAAKRAAQECAELRALVNHFVRGPLRHELTSEVELAAQTAHTFGYAILHPYWRQEDALMLQKLKRDEILAQAQKAAPADVVAMLASLMSDPTLREQAVELLVQLFPRLRRARARQVVKELQEDGEAEFPLAQQAMNAPSVCALVPGQDVLLPADTVDLQRARMIFHRVWMTEQQLVADGATQGWSEDWVDAAKTHAKTRLTDNTTVTGWNQLTTQVWDEQNKFVEVVWAYVRQNDADGVPGVYCTIFCPDVADDYGKHYLVDYAHGQYPFVVYRTETASRRLADARGVPDVLLTTQKELKNQRDALYNFAQISIIPPLRKTGLRALHAPDIRPAGVLYELVRDEWQWFAPPPGKPEVAFSLIETIKKEVNEYYGRLDETANVGRAQMRQQRLVTNWLLAWSEVFWQLAVLAYQYLTPEELAILLGRPPVLTAQLVARHKVGLSFDVRALDSEWVLGMVQAMNQFVLPADTAGVVDHAKYVQFIVSYFDPALADEVVLDQQQAAQAIFNQVRNDVAQMALGNEAIYTENDPAAKMKLQFTQQTVQANPKYQQALQADERFRMLFEKYLKNLQMSVTQEQNKQVGRLGVEPEMMQGAN